MITMSYILLNTSWDICPKNHIVIRHQKFINLFADILIRFSFNFCWDQRIWNYQCCKIHQKYSLFHFLGGMLRRLYQSLSNYYQLYQLLFYVKSLFNLIYSEQARKIRILFISIHCCQSNIFLKVFLAYMLEIYFL